jgi:hypothetical protein
MRKTSKKQHKSDKIQLDQTIIGQIILNISILTMGFFYH